MVYIDNHLKPVFPHGKTIQNCSIYKVNGNHRVLLWLHFNNGVRTSARNKINRWIIFLYLHVYFLGFSGHDLASTQTF